MKVVLLGPPGAGKGTQAKLICDEFKIPHISTGDIFRKHISEKTPLGIKAKEYIDKGKLVPDEITLGIVKDRLSKDDCKNGYLFDGFPRTVAQAEEFDRILLQSNAEIDSVILIDVPDKYIIDRITGRRVCPVCGESYHIINNPPKETNKCDECGSLLIQRKDDSINTINERLFVYHKQTCSLVEYYKKKNILSVVDGTEGIGDIFQNICTILRRDNKK